MGGDQIPYGAPGEDEDEGEIPSEGEDPDDLVNWYDDLMKKHLRFALGGDEVESK